MRINFNKLDNNFNKNPTLQKNGVQLIKSFINNEKLEILISEINKYFDEPLFNSIHGSIWQGSRYLPGKKLLKFIPNVSRIRSINILELAVDVANLLPNRKEIKLTNLEIDSERNNDAVLALHTDRRRGMIRAQIYLKGGDKNSGTFQYIQNTHNLDHDVEHHLNNDEIKKLNHNIFDCVGDPGDLMIIDTWGFHGKKKCVDERIMLRFEFQPNHLIEARASIDLNNLNLTKKVIENLDIFIPNHETKDECYKSNHGVDLKNINYPISFVGKAFIKILSILLINYLGVINKFFKNNIRIFSKIMKIF
jgi:hypothetical protein